MKAFFPSDAILGRNGGDEFCVLLPNYTFEEAEAQLQQFTSLPKDILMQRKGVAILYFSWICGISDLCIQSVHSSCAVQMQLSMK